MRCWLNAISFANALTGSGGACGNASADSHWSAARSGHLAVLQLAADSDRAGSDAVCDCQRCPALSDSVQNQPQQQWQY